MKQQKSHALLVLVDSLSLIHSNNTTNSGSNCTQEPPSTPLFRSNLLQFQYESASCKTERVPDRTAWEKYKTQREKRVGKQKIKEKNTIFPRTGETRAGCVLKHFPCCFFSRSSTLLAYGGDFWGGSVCVRVLSLSKRDLLLQ